MDEAVALTWSTLNRRIRNLRAGAIAVGLGLAALILAAALWRSGWALAGIPLLFLATSVCHARDLKLAFAWEDRVLALWAEDKVVMGIFATAFAHQQGQVKAILQGMLAHLPVIAPTFSPPPDSIRADRCLFWIRSAFHEARLYRGSAAAILVACAPFAAWLGWKQDRGGPALGLLPLALILPARYWLLAWARARCLKRCRSLAPWKPDTGFAQRVETLDARGTPRGFGRTLLAALEGYGALRVNAGPIQ
jgi:hypothetical protein